MYEKRGHLVDGVRHEGVLPQHDGCEQRPVGEAEESGEENPSARDGDPDVEEDEDIGEVAEVEHEVVIAQRLVRVPAVGEQGEGFLGKKSFRRWVRGDNTPIATKF